TPAWCTGDPGGGLPAGGPPQPRCHRPVLLPDSPGLSRGGSVTRGPGLGTNEGSCPPLSQVFPVRGYLALFIAASLSTWGDYIARLTIAAVVYERTKSPIATATTLAVSLVPSIFGRSLLGSFADGVPYKYVLIASHATRTV